MTAYILRRPPIPFVPGYAVVGFADAEAPTRAPEDIAQLWAHAHREARRLSLERFGHAEGYSLLYNGARTRRRPWPHVHIVLAESVEDKRRAFFFLSLKRLLRPARWPLTRALVELGEMPAPTLALSAEDLP